MDKNNDKLISFSEFKEGHQMMGIQVDPVKLREEFNSIDKDHSGTIEFDEVSILDR